MTTTLGSKELPPAPSPLPANWGYFTRYAHGRDIGMMTMINGVERTPDHYRVLIERAGLTLKKIWDCRSSVGLMEVVLPGSGI